MEWPKLEFDPLKDQDWCFGCGQSNPIGLKLKFSWDEKSRTSSAEFTPDKTLQGWAGFLHGGIAACVLDEAIGWASMFAGTNNVTAKMQVRYRRMIPVNQTYLVACRVAKQTSRLIETEAKITDQNGSVFAEAVSTQFIVSQREGKPKTNNRTVRAVLWDMDGVIADTALPHCRSWQFAFNKQGIKFSDAEFQRVFGQRNDLIIRKMMGQDLNQTLIDQISEDKEVFFREDVVKQLHLFPGVSGLLQLLKENGIACAVGSSAPLENVEVILNGLKIADYFQAVVFGLEVKEGKPSPQVFLKAAQKIGAEPANCIVIEDSVAGVTAAKKAGMACIAVTNTHPVEALKAADWVVGSLEEVRLADLERLFTANNKK
jgi:beta-phosphoglucomutase family hydrolase